MSALFFCSISCPHPFEQELSGGHALWYTGMLTLYHYNFVGVFSINPAVRLTRSGSQAVSQHLTAVVFADLMSPDAPPALS